MKYIIAVILSAALLLNLHDTPVNKQVVHRVSTHKVTAVVKPSATQTVVQPQPVKTPAVAIVTPPVVKPVSTYGTHVELMKAAGINPADYGAVDYIVSHESSWNPNATEPTSGAHGLIQALPYSKTGCGWSDAVCQLRWGGQYATIRYGGWQKAYSSWMVNHWW